MTSIGEIRQQTGTAVQYASGVQYVVTSSGEIGNWMALRHSIDQASST